MNSLRGLRNRAESLLTDPGKELSRRARFVRFQVDLWRFCARRLWENNLSAMSSALSFRTVFALIPLLVLILLMAKAVGVLEDGKRSLHQALDASGFTEIAVMQAVDPSVATEPATGTAEPDKSASTTAAPAGIEPDAPLHQTGRVINLGDEIEALVDNVESKLTFQRVGPVGALLMIWTALTLLTSMEQSLNRIFGATRNRSIVRRTFLYWSVMTLAPVVLAAMVYLGQQLIASVENMTGIAWLLAVIGWLAPVIGGILVLSTLYKLLPNADVPFRSALGGAIVAVPLWLIAKWAFGLYVNKCVVTGNLYGAIGLLPLFLMWLNLSWSIFLFGAQLAHTAFHLTDFEAMEQAKRLTLGPTDFLAAAVAVAEPHLAGVGPVAYGQIAARLQLPDECVQHLLDRLMASGLICPVQSCPGQGFPVQGEDDETDHYVLARSAGTIPILDVLDIRASQFEQTHRRYDEGVQAVVERVRHEADSSMGSLMLADLIPPKPNAS